MGRGLRIAKAAALATGPEKPGCKHMDEVEMRDGSILCADCGKLIKLPTPPMNK